MTKEYERDHWDLDPRRRRSANGCPISNHIPIEMDEKIEYGIRKNLKSVGNRP